MVGPGDDANLSAFWNMCFLSPLTLEIVAPPLSTSNISFRLGRNLPYLKPFKNDEKCFLFHLKSSFSSQGI